MDERKQANDDNLIGKRLGNFEILEEIGRGGMATVYRAHQTTINRIVAIKVLPRHFLHDPGFYERFTREVEVIADLEHPHILPIYDYGEAEGLPFIAMRYLGGGSLAQMIRRGVPPLNAIDKPFSQIAQALDYAHQKGIIHRDLKPGNVMLDENGNAYLTDFGIARVLGSELTGSAIIGTPAYMSPEQANGLPIDARSDIYALGVVLFELITGREPYQAETPMALLLKHINEPMPLARNFREGVPPGVDDVIGKATAKNPDDRFSSAGDMARAFSAALRGGEIPATRTPQATRPAAAPEPAPMAAPQMQYTPPPTGQPYPAPTPYPPQTPYPGQPPYQTGQPYPATGPITGQMPARGPSTSLLLVAIVVIAVVAIAAVALIATRSNPLPIPTSTPVVSFVPTAFPRASTIAQDLYTISSPNDWIPPQMFIDKSTGDHLRHVWEAEDKTAFVQLVLERSPMPDSASFQAAIKDYDVHNPLEEKNAAKIDEATAPDGTLRRSYRVPTGSVTPGQGGQVDVFYINRNPYLAVLQVYSADTTGNNLVPLFQNVLDSLRVKTVSS
jgi:serine/threonine-protein kinase